MKTQTKTLALQVLATVIGGFILALMIAECRESRHTHDAVLRLEEKTK